MTELNRALAGLADPFAIPTEVKQKPAAAARPFDARMPNAHEDDGPIILLSAAARSMQELRAAADHADRALAARAHWIVNRLKLEA